MLQGVDFAAAYTAAMTEQRTGRWSAAAIRHQLGLPRATLSKSLGRLEEAGLVREAYLNRRLLAALLPLLPNLIPARPLSAIPVRGLVTGFAAPAFGGHFRAPMAHVWELDAGPDLGLPIKPLHRQIPGHLMATGDARVHALMAYLDAVRGGRAREVAHGGEGVRLLCGLPASPGLRPSASTEALMGELVGRLPEGGVVGRVAVDA